MIDLREHPDLERSKNITAVMTMIRVSWTPLSRKIMGMLGDIKKVLDEPDLKGNEEDFGNTGRITSSIAH